MSDLDLYRSSIPASSRRGLRRLEADSRMQLAQGQLALQRKYELASQGLDDLAFLAMKEAAYSSALPHAAHRFALWNDQITMQMLESIRRAG